MLTRCDRWTRQKVARVEPGLQLVEGPVVRCPAYLPGNNVNRIVGQRGIDDVFGLHQNYRSPTLTATWSRRFCRPATITIRTSWSSCRPAAGPRARRPRAARLHRPGPVEPGGIHRLQQVVDGVDLERLDRVLVEGRDEHDRRRSCPAPASRRGHLEARSGPASARRERPCRARSRRWSSSASTPLAAWPTTSTPSIWSSR